MQERKPPAADHQIFERYGFVGFVKYRRDYDAATAPQQLLGQRHDEIQDDAPVAFGNRPHLRHDRHLLDLKRHHALSVGKRIHGCKKERIAVTLQLHNLRATVLLPLLPFGTGKLRERGCRPMPLKPSSHRAAEHHPQAAAENCSGNYDFPFFHP